MGHFRKGQSDKNRNLWQKAGGIDAIIKCFISLKFNEGVPTYDQWLSFVFHVFKSNDKKYLKWLKLIWASDCKGIRTKVLNAGTVIFVFSLLVTLLLQYYLLIFCVPNMESHSIQN